MTTPLKSTSGCCFLMAATSSRLAQSEMFSSRVPIMAPWVTAFESCEGEPDIVRVCVCMMGFSLE